jgi:hypothetical protein
MLRPEGTEHGVPHVEEHAADTCPKGGRAERKKRNAERHDLLLTVTNEAPSIIQATRSGQSQPGLRMEPAQESHCGRLRKFL